MHDLFIKISASMTRINCIDKKVLFCPVSIGVISLLCQVNFLIIFSQMMSGNAVDDHSDQMQPPEVIKKMIQTYVLLS
jgi:hypothetical protein